MSDTQDPSPQTDTQDPNQGATATQEPPAQTQQQAPPQPDFKWKESLNPDFANSPTMQKYGDTKDGLNDAVKGHLELQKLMGHEKVPIPKGPDDKPAMELFKKAMRVPEKPSGYALNDPQLPDSMKDTLKFNKDQFAEIVHKHNLSPDQAKGLWNAYTELGQKEYSDQVKAYEDSVAEASNQMRREWGDAYDGKIEVGQMVINKFTDSKEQNDFITASLAKDPNGIKFLARIGEQFAENKVGDFKYQRYSLTPEEAQREIDSIVGNENHPYNNDKASNAERERAIGYVNSLYAVLNKAKTRTV